MKPIYLDTASTTPVDPRVLKEMMPSFSKKYANPSSIHEWGKEAKEAVEDARSRVADILHCRPNEIIFTSGGTESVNLALKGVAFARKKGQIITTSVEHAAVLETCRYLETKGFTVTYLPVDNYGLVSVADVKKAITKDTILISVIYANNEIGTIEPIRHIGAIARRHAIPFHTDACQAGTLGLDTKKITVDLMTINGSKLYGPKGVGILYRNKAVPLEPLFHGGGQEFGMRGGTENVPAIVGFAKALELAQRNRQKTNRYQSSLRDYFIAKLQQAIPQTALNGHPTKRLANNVNISFAGVEAEVVLKHLSQQGMYASAGAACDSRNIETSHVLKAINAPYPYGSIRFSLGRHTTKKELEQVAKALKGIVEALRKM